MLYVALGPADSPEIKSGPYPDLAAAIAACPPGWVIWDSSSNKTLDMAAFRQGSITWI
jgi:hypothetical protein